MRHLFQKVYNLFKKKKSKQNSDQAIDNSRTNYVDYSHAYKLYNILTDDFYTNLIKTINWTEEIINEINDATQINFTSILRKTNPVYKGNPFYCYTDTQSGFASTPQIPFNYFIILNEVLVLRENTTLSVRDINQLGQIIEFDIDLTTHDGAPCAESEGFVDESDIPPIDTWFYLTQSKLYCWIPNMFIGKMQGAIEVEIFDSYRWLKNSNPDLYVQIVEKLSNI